MATPLFACGFECRQTIAGSAPSPDERHWSGVGTSPTISTSTVRASHVVSLRNNSTSAQNLNHAIAAGNRTIAGRIYFRAAAFPTGTDAPHILNFSNASGNGVIRVQSSGQVQIAVGASANVNVGSALSTGTWYRLDFLFDTSGATASMKCRIDGGTEASATNSQAAADTTVLRLGTFQATTVAPDYFFSDLDLDADASAYPIGPGFVYRDKPTRDSSHSFTAGDFGYDTAGADIATNATDVFGKLDDDDLTSTTDLVRQKVIRTAGYLQVGFGSAPLTHDPVAVNVVYSFMAAGTGADTFGVKANDGGTVAALTNAAGTGLTDVSQTSVMVMEKMLATPPSGGAWTKAKLEALLIRGGYSDDVNAVPYWVGLMLEVVYRGVIVAGASPTALTLATFAPTVTKTNNQRVTAGLATLATTKFAPVLKLQLTPATKALSTATFAPTVLAPRLATPATKALTLATFAPTVSAPRLVTPGVTALVTARFAPAAVLGTRIVPATASLTSTGFAPALAAGIIIPLRALTTARFAPSLAAGINIPTRALTLTAFAPTVSTPRTVTPGVTALVTAAFAPTVTVEAHGVTVTPDTATLTTSAFAPAIATPRRAVPATATLTTSAFAPAVQTPRLATPATASLTTARFAPAVQSPRLATPATATLTTSAFAPAISSPRTVTPGTRSLAIAAFAPIVLAPRVAVPATASLTTSAFAPSALSGIRIIPAPASLATATFAPTITRPRTVTPGTRALTLTGHAPQLKLAVVPLPVALQLAGLAPRVDVPATVTPSTAELELGAFAPDLGGSWYLEPATAALELIAYRARTITPGQLRGRLTSQGISGVLTPSSRIGATLAGAGSIRGSIAKPAGVGGAVTRSGPLRGRLDEVVP